MHKTATLDYAIVLKGEIWLEVDNGKMVHLHEGDVVIQQATRHGWRNLGTEPAVMGWVMLGQ